MKNKILFLAGVLIFAVLLSACSGAAASPAQAPLAANEENGESDRTLSVSGSGKVTLTPDIAYITVGVHTEGKNAAEAVAENNNTTQAVTGVLLDAGVDDKDIKTTNFSIYPQQQYDDQGKPTGEIIYIVDNSVFVTVRDLDTVGELLNDVVDAGANSIRGIQFDVEDKTDALAEAQEMAVANAQAQAENLAQAAGVELGPIKSINAFGGVIPGPKFEGLGGGAMIAEAAAVPISPGEMTVTTDVSIIYIIR
jgi:uncharacterized protein YggE